MRKEGEEGERMREGEEEGRVKRKGREGGLGGGGVPNILLPPESALTDPKHLQLHPHRAHCVREATSVRCGRWAEPR